MAAQRLAPTSLTQASQLRPLEAPHPTQPPPQVSLAAQQQQALQAVLPFSKLNKLFFGYFDPENILIDYKHK